MPVAQGVRSRVAIACQGGGSHTAFTAGVLQELLANTPEEVDIVALSGTSGGAICAALAWSGLVSNDRPGAIEKLHGFWEAIAAVEPLDQLFNQFTLQWMELRDLISLPEISPYRLPTWGEDYFRAVVESYFDFDTLRRLARQPEAPGLHIGAVEVLSGRFELFTGAELRVECLLASAAIPEIFRAVRVPGRGVYWDGLFSQNPPIHDLTDFRINELWVVQINPTSCAQLPNEVHEIQDRRNALAGNLSMEQELKQIESINRALAKGILKDTHYRPISVSRVKLDRELGYRSKLDRRPDFIRDLREYGRAKARNFLKDREDRKYTLQAMGVLAPQSNV